MKETMEYLKETVTDIQDRLDEVEDKLDGDDETFFDRNKKFIEYIIKSLVAAGVYAAANHGMSIEPPPDDVFTNNKLLYEYNQPLGVYR